MHYIVMICNSQFQQGSKRCISRWKFMRLHIHDRACCLLLLHNSLNFVAFRAPLLLLKLLFSAGIDRRRSGFKVNRECALLQRIRFLLVRRPEIYDVLPYSWRQMKIFRILNKREKRRITDQQHNTTIKHHCPQSKPMAPISTDVLGTDIENLCCSSCNQIREPVTSLGCER